MKSAIQLMTEGYAKLQKQEGEIEVIKKDNPEERPLSPIELLIAGYNKDGSQKNQETKIDVSEEKQGGE